MNKIVYVIYFEKHGFYYNKENSETVMFTPDVYKANQYETFSEVNMIALWVSKLPNVDKEFTIMRYLLTTIMEPV